MVTREINVIKRLFIVGESKILKFNDLLQEKRLYEECREMTSFSVAIAIHNDLGVRKISFPISV